MRSAAAARVYLMVQAAAGAGWWTAVAASDRVRIATLGGWPVAPTAAADLCLFVGASAIAGIRRSWPWAAVAAAWTVAVTIALTGYGLATGRAGWGVVFMVPCAVLTVAAAATLQAGTVPLQWFFLGPFRFQVAKDRPSRAHVAASLVQLAVFWTTFFVAVPAVLAWAEGRLQIEAHALDRTWAIPAGAALLAAGSALGLSSCLTMARIGHGTPLPAATARRLVVAGPYRYVRNPMAVAGAAQTIGVGILIGAWTVVVAAVAGAVVWNIAIRPDEEADLALRFGAEYEAYCAAVRCWLPRRPPAVESLP